MTDMNNSSNQQPINPAPKYDYTPISMWGYFGYEILFAIPLVDLICLLIFSLGGTKKVNLRNFARSYFCILIILVIFLGVPQLLGGM